MQKEQKISISRVLSGAEYVSHAENRFFKKLILKALSVLEKVIGMKMFVAPPEIPSPLTHSVTTLGKIKHLAKIQEDELIEKIYFIKQPADEPFMHIAVTENGTENMGSSENFFDPENALDRAVGEAIERYAWDSDEFLRKEILLKTEAEIQKKGAIVLLSSLAGFSHKEREKRPSMRYTPDTKFGWTKGISLITKKPIWVPAQIVSGAYFGKYYNRVEGPSQKDQEPLIRWCVTTGMAAGKSKEALLLTGAIEVIERDAFMITYLNKLSPPVINLEDLATKSEELRDVLQRFKRYSFKNYLVELPTDFPVTVLLSILIDSTEKGPRIVVGMAAGFNAEKTALRALGESLKIYRLLRKNFRPGVFEKFTPEHLTRYSRLVYWAQKKNTEDINFLLKGPRKKLEFKKQPENPLQLIIETCRNKNYELCYVDLSFPRLKKNGWYAGRVIIPQLQPLNLIEYVPYHGGDRLHSVPTALGYEAAKELNQEPHPFS